MAARLWRTKSPRAIAALQRQARIQQAQLPPRAPLAGLDGAPLRPQWVLDQLRRRTAAAELPTIGLHDLRHTAATIMIASGVPIAIVSKTLRHSTLSTTVNLYGHLLPYAALEAVAALANALDTADADHDPDRPNRALARTGV
ncbi:hypothetical protein DN069_27915 [Streptacidiphilus pinicola]|uniref:Tyr recombinase domain-containing protein n=1 Tax=Streptacidiphilus pinicola TaxID=2219663 RepID=A0A2X0IFZ7_9ACTN|nr:tyrosine-type recombinase/integrase [Streptacidiphilus pinicola]RAG82351.1 hypothetical protein DN069_27915 [Streptacidiphilus pinicola]